MDPVSFTASLVAILGIAGSATKLSMTLYSIARKAGSAGLGIERFAMDVGTFASVVQIAHRLLNEHCHTQTRLQTSLVLQHIEENEVLNQLVAQSKSVINQIKLVRTRLKSIQSSFDFIARLKCHLRRTEIQALGLRIESVKTNLLLVISLVHLEAAKQQSPSAETDQLIKDLEYQVKLHLRTIQMLQDRIEQNDFVEFHDVAQVAQDVLVDLGQRATRNSRSRQARSPSFRESGRGANIREPQNPPSLLEEETSPQSAPSQSIVSGLELSVVPSTTPTSHSMSNIPHVQSNSGSYHSSRSTPISVIRNEGDFVSVKPTSYLLELNPDHEIESVNGWVNGVHITAILDRDFDENLISQALVIKIGLEIQPPGEDDVLINFGGHQEQGEPSLGTVILEWSEGPGSTRRPFSVPCYVCAHNIRTLILGQSFVERAAHYWPPRPRA